MPTACVLLFMHMKEDSISFICELVFSLKLLQWRHHPETDIASQHCVVCRVCLENIAL